MRKWEIRPFHVGTLSRSRSQFLYMHPGEPIDVPVTMFLLESGDTKVLVDTGCGDPAEAGPGHQPIKRAAHRNALETVEAAGVDPRSIHLVVNTHLHWDHCCGNELFPWARFLVQRKELRYAGAPLPWNAQSYDSFLLGLKPAWASIPFQVVDGDTQLMEGLRVLLMPGHTPGMQCVLVEAETGPYLLASDNVPLYDNWEGKPPHIPHIPNNNHYDLSDYYETFRKIEATGARVIPSHDFRVFDTAVYR